MMANGTLNHLSNDILTKANCDAMAVSLETRTPFVGHRVAAVACRLSMTMKILPYRTGGSRK